jgi:hypothetical protein
VPSFAGADRRRRVDAADFLIAFVLPPTVSVDYIERATAERGLAAARTFSDLTTACTALGLDGERVQGTVDVLRRSLTTDHAP